ncbi:hypothetical protein NDU88_000511 [Pleurodeles waltl]|uniref:Uncharacterized protein n=1 Tax=Pleurodeles waltl TaxID=8319 RepID=A0AAV7VXL2_PLEWA|nr:hypothetical protein NDU88_000511 [Pleurodeles waltl]
MVPKCHIQCYQGGTNDAADRPEARQPPNIYLPNFMSRANVSRPEPISEPRVAGAVRAANQKILRLLPPPGHPSLAGLYDFSRGWALLPYVCSVSIRAASFLNQGVATQVRFPRAPYAHQYSRCLLDVGCLRPPLGSSALPCAGGARGRSSRVKVSDCAIRSQSQSGLSSASHVLVSTVLVPPSLWLPFLRLAHSSSMEPLMGAARHSIMRQG